MGRISLDQATALPPAGKDRPAPVVDATPRATAAANDDAIETHLFDIDSLWARESPILVEWRSGRASKRLRGLDPLKEAAMNLLASVRIYFRYLVTAEAWALSLVSVAATLFFIFAIDASESELLCCLNAALGGGRR